MREALFMLLFFCLSAGTALGQSQAERNMAACGAAKKADAELNAAYAGILKKMAGDTLFIEKLKVAQRAWVAFRDAELTARFPATDKSEYGTIYNLCYCTELAELTRRRTEQLKPWQDGVEQGDGCVGSYPVQP